MIAEKHQIPYVECPTDMDIDDACDVYLVAGAGILSPDCVKTKSVVNAHPGIIPVCRGLDSFKWSIYHDRPLGNTLHFIDQGVDSGQIISVKPTNVYKTDSLQTLARRHYENENQMLSCFDDYLENPVNDFVGIESNEPTRRMPATIERDMVRLFERYVEKWGQ